MSDFLDDLVSDQQFNDNVDQWILGQIEMLIWQSSLDDIQKSKQTKKMLKLESMDEAFKMVGFLKEYQPNIGTHRAPMTAYETVQATRERADRDDFKERKR